MRVLPVTLVLATRAENAVERAADPAFKQEDLANTSSDGKITYNETVIHHDLHLANDATRKLSDTNHNHAQIMQEFGCKDKSTFCRYMKANCAVTRVQKECPKTCNKCPQTPKHMCRNGDSDCPAGSTCRSGACQAAACNTFPDWLSCSKFLNRCLWSDETGGKCKAPQHFNGYDFVGNGGCSDYYGHKPSRYKKFWISLAECQAHCTAAPACLAFDYAAVYHQCDAYGPDLDRGDPHFSGWAFDKKFGSVVTTMNYNDLFICYKNSDAAELTTETAEVPRTLWMAWLGASVGLAMTVTFARYLLSNRGTGEMQAHLLETEA